MKISLITITYNAAATVRTAIESVLSQSYPNIEYILVDGGSTDGTLEIVKEYGTKIEWKSEPDKGIYDAMAKGVARASGDVIGMVNADDFFPDNEVIQRVVDTFLKNPGLDAVYGDLHYVDAGDTAKVVREWVAGEYKKELFLSGWMPPHPTFFLTKKAYLTYGSYNPVFKSAGDYELMLRMLYKYELKAKYIPQVQMKMRTGGVSNVSLRNRIRANNEDYQAWILNGLTPKWYTRFAKPLSKIRQWF
ncbi:MAG: glycosyltransferase family 2 protein [Spirosomataceae bacterium]